MQEAFAAALVAWREKGIPRNPVAWMIAAAHRKLIDHSRRERTKRGKEDSLRYETPSIVVPELTPGEEDSMHFPDDRLRLMFTCCHPAIHQEAQVALTLRTLGGLTTPEIAKAFLTPEATLAQRLVRAKRKIQDARIPYEIPAARDLADRLEPVQAVIYLIFNEGYAAATGNRLLRNDLCNEAIRLGRLLCELLPGEAENLGLLALILLHDSRRETRTVDGRLVTLEDQDRSRWDRKAIAEGAGLVEKALGMGRPGPYQIQAAIAALHAQARSGGETDWPQIAALYERLWEMNPSPVIALNHAAAVAMSGQLEEGLRRIDGLVGLENYYLFHAARADILRRMNRRPEAAEAYRRALELAGNLVEKEFLRRRLEDL